jgi:hypothetical protein
MSATHSRFGSSGLAQRARFGQVRQLCRPSVVTMKRRFRTLNRLSARISRNTRL